MAQLNYETDEPSLFGTFTPENFELLEQGRGPLTSNIPEAGAFFRTRPGLDAPDMRVPLRAVDVLRRGADRAARQRLLLRPGRVKPTSRGRVLLRAPLRRLQAARAVQLPHDRRGPPGMIAGMRMALEIAEQAPLKAVTAGAVQRARRRLRRGRSCASSSAPAQSVYHPTSTCAIGSVVDPQLRVLRHRRPARRRRVGDADGHARQHQRGDDHDRREGRRPDRSGAHSSPSH